MSLRFSAGSNKYLLRTHNYAHTRILLEQGPKHVIINRYQGERLNRTRMKPLHELGRKKCLPQQIHAEPVGLGLNNHDVFPGEGNLGLPCYTELPPLRITPSSRRTPQVRERRTAQNSSTSVPPICCQYHRVIGVSRLLMAQWRTLPNVKSEASLTGSGPAMLWSVSNGQSCLNCSACQRCLRGLVRASICPAHSQWSEAPLQLNIERR